MVLQEPSEPEHHRHRHQSCEEGIEPERGDQHEDQERAEHDQVAMGEVDEPHDAEDEAQTRCEEGVEPAQQYPLHDCVDPDHAAAPK